MAGSFLEIDGNTDGVRHALGTMIDYVKNPEPAMKIVGEIVTRSVRKNFDAEGRPGPWAPHARSTINRTFAKSLNKKGQFKSKKIADRIASRRILSVLGMRGGLMGSIHYEVEGGTVRIGTDKIYGAIHQKGGVTGRRRARFIMPARPFLLVQEEDRGAIIGAVRGYIEKSVARATK